MISKQDRNFRGRAAGSSLFSPKAGLNYIAFFKPYGVLTQFSPEAGSNKRTLAEFGFPKRVYPLGRLDFDSEGLLLLSDDRRLNNLLLDPEHGHNRCYLAQVERIPEDEALEKLASGVMIEGRKSRPAQVRLLKEEPFLPEREVPIRFRKNVPTAWLELTLCEGKNRQVRKMTAAIGHPTLRLLRIAIGRLQLFDLNLHPGEWQKLSPEELDLCFQES
ncbi:MAG: pseudouridine synthase [Candidatus Obscuribacterales bacterium]|nr:pseudouridine synthase [Candidatus Obscuribacterales bacterium]